MSTNPIDKEWKIAWERIYPEKAALASSKILSIAAAEAGAEREIFKQAYLDAQFAEQPTHFESNGEAGDGQTVCNVCNMETADGGGHPMSVCVSNLRRENDELWGLVDRYREDLEQSVEQKSDS